MAGDPDKADLLFRDAIAQGLASGVMVGPCVALAERSLLAIADGEWDSREQYLDQARTLARDANLDDQPPITILYAAAARVALHHGDRQRAREELARAQRLRPALTYAIPHLAVQASLSWPHATSRCPTRPQHRPCSARSSRSSSSAPTSACSCPGLRNCRPGWRRCRGQASPAHPRSLPPSCDCRPSSVPIYHSRRSARNCSCLPTPSSPRRTRCTENWESPTGTRQSRNPVSSVSWMREGAPSCLAALA
jgi:hypothetical protein